VAEQAGDEAGFFARLREAGVLVRLRFSQTSPGQVTCYAVGLPAMMAVTGSLAGMAAAGCRPS
jgi:hypothetical protein